MEQQSDFLIKDGVLTGYTGPGGEVIIPTGVTAIGERVFNYRKDLTSVILPDGLQTIGYGAFWKCDNLKKVTIADSVTSIESGAFWNCKSLKKLTLPDDIPSMGVCSFNGCKSLADEAGFVIINHILYDYYGTAETVLVPEGVTEIQSFGLMRCRGRVSCILPDTVTRIADSAINEKVVVCLVAPGIPFSSTKRSTIHSAATLGFLTHRNKYTNEETVREYEQYALSQMECFLPEIFRDDLMEAVAFYAQKGKITAENYERAFLTPAQQANAIGCVAFLMDWKHKNLSSSEQPSPWELPEDPYDFSWPI